MIAKKRRRKAAPKPETVLVLRTCRADMTSPAPEARGFHWPESGPVEAPDWEPNEQCGHGLHGFLWGEGSPQTSGGYYEPDAKWLVVEVAKADVIDLGGKCKFPRGVVVFCGGRLAATAWLAERAPGKAIVYGTSTSGDDGTSTSGDGGTSTSGARGTSTSGARGTSTSGARGTSTSGDGGTSTSGARGTSTSGARGTSTSGVYGTSTSGDYGTSTSGADGTSTSGADGTSTSGDGGTSTSGGGGTSTSGVYGTSTSGARGTSTSGDGGTSTSGDGGTSTSGARGTSTSGARGTSTSGVYGTSTSGDGGTICVRYWDPKAERYRIAIGYVGEDGIKPDTAYVCDKNGKLVRKDGK